MKYKTFFISIQSNHMTTTMFYSFCFWRRTNVNS